jgi:hypothetical protein
MRGKAALLCYLSCLFVMVFSSLADALPNNTDTTITDLSWPNCGQTLSESNVGIIGIDGGLDFHPNPCLYKESKLFNTYAVYLNTGYPGSSYGKKHSSFPLSCSSTDYTCLAYNYGFDATRYSITYANSNLVHSFMWWLDVETSNSWTNNGVQNRAELTGMIDAIRQYTFLPSIGFYSYPGQWDSITHGWGNDYPVWVDTGTASPKVAVSFCQNENFTGGNTWLSQYTTDLDHNYICSSNYLQHLSPSVNESGHSAQDLTSSLFEMNYDIVK